MNKEIQTLWHIITSPSKAQLLLSLCGLAGYFVDVYLSVYLYGFDRTHPGLIEYLVEITLVLCVCNFTVIGNTYLATQFDHKYISHRPVKITPYLFKIALQVMVSLLICNVLFTIEALITSIQFNIFDVLAINIFILPFSLIYYTIENATNLIKHYKTQQIDIERIQKEKLHTELQLLRAQFNPHFIFNAINTIYFQIDSDDPHSRQILPRFKNILTYLTDWCQHDYVPLGKELDYLQNYIDIQMIRKGEEIKTSFEYDFDSLEYEISPFLLQPFIENAFKYISGKMELTVNLRIINGNLFYTVKNSVDPAFYNMNTRKGIGLKNLKKRLQLIYPDKYFMQSNAKEDCFVAEMQLELK